jgi:hypothetical protein
MKGLSLLFVSVAISMFLAGSVFEQDAAPQPTSSLMNDDRSCGLRSPVAMTMMVSVWSNKRSEFIDDLTCTDFEIHDGLDVREIDYFLRPSEAGTSLRKQNEYTLGFFRQSWEDKTPPTVKIKVKKPIQGLVIRVTPGGLID